MEKVESKKVLKRLIFMTLFLIVFGVIIFIFNDRMVGSSIFVGGILGLIFGGAYYTQLKKRGLESAKKSLYLFYILAGVILLLLTMVLLLLGKVQLKDSLYGIVLGFLFLMGGIQGIKGNPSKEKSWKRFPLWARILIILIFLMLLLFLERL